MPKYFTASRISENIAETPEGFLLCLNVPITRTGSFLYGEDETPLETDDDGEIQISREMEDIFDEKHIASLEGKPITINHPTNFVDSHNWKDLAKGHMQNVRKGPKIVVDGQEQDTLLADLLVKDFLAIQLVKNGLREVSLGYEAEYEQTGEGKGKQSLLRANHIALVEAGRAGQLCAVTDNMKKGESTMSKLAELLKKLSKVADEEMPEKKDDKAKDADEDKEEKKDDKKDDKASDASAYDEIVKMMKDMSAKLDGMKPESKDDKMDGDEKKEDKKDEEKGQSEDDNSVESRLDALEAALAKILESQTGDEEEMEDEETESEESEDVDVSSFTGDTAARAEILSPGIKQSKNVKSLSLKAAYGTKEGKQVIDSLTGGKPTFDSAEKVESLFIAASEVLKHKRGTGLEGTKNAKSFDSSSAVKAEDGSRAPMTAEKMNEANKVRYNLNN